ncbi:cadmium-translocating P-type ATPase [Flavobacteriaceae bacterium F08102]|nr:cadmium-translocating P-type ATPase [Flavobacteriaceae bacterium F08102]
MTKKQLPLESIAKKTKPTHNHEHHTHNNPTRWKTYFPVTISFVLLLIGMLFDQFNINYFKAEVRLAWYILAYLPVGWPVIKTGWNLVRKGNFFTEFFLMSLATIGAFALGEYPEGVAVMLFYAIGELFQDAAVKKAKGSINALLDVRPTEALVHQGNSFVKVDPKEVQVGDIVQVRVGEKIPLDGILTSERASLNTAAITGEAKPDTVHRGDTVYAGSINLEEIIEIKVTKLFEDSSIARILQLVQNATTRKSKTELFIRKFAKVYTPIVVFLAIGLTFIPALFVSEYVFSDWLYRALIFLVISCPCALVISIPLGYFGGLGAASRNGILFKGATFLDAITKINTVALDKTGTLTKGVFKIKEIVVFKGTEDDFMAKVQSIEKQSTHPIALAILAYTSAKEVMATEVKELAGLGLMGQVQGETLSIGNAKLMSTLGVAIPEETRPIVESVVFVAINKEFAGYFVIADELKEDAQQAINNLKAAGIKSIVMLSGDQTSIVNEIGKKLGLNEMYGGLLPEDKLRIVEQMQANRQARVAFVGDGINDAPVLAVSDVGLAMGGLGSDVAIETADIVIQTDQPSKIAQAIQIGKSTRRIVWQNIALAFGVKIIVLLLGAGGLATMWEAVFADVGVALLAILNAVRLQRMKWN